jgi:transcription elongation factor Elf1
MVKAEYRFLTDRELFECPLCGGLDVVYIRQPLHCHYCGEPYNFDVSKLRKDVAERIRYFIGKDKEIHAKFYS